MACSVLNYAKKHNISGPTLYAMREMCHFLTPALQCVEIASRLQSGYQLLIAEKNYTRKLQILTYVMVLQPLKWLLTLPYNAPQ